MLVGVNRLWAQRYQFPETAVQVICRDQFAMFDQLKAAHPVWQFVDIAERLLPFTSVQRQFKGDRYGEFSRNRGIFRSRKFDRFTLFQHDYFRAPIPADADFAAQVVSRQPVAFRHTG